MRCQEPGCNNYVYRQERCHQHGGIDLSTNIMARPLKGYTPNPWAAIAPECPRGHHSRRVYRWSYEDGEIPWFCAECSLLFTLPVPAPKRALRRV